MFSDRAKICIRSGKGGDGHVSFRREKYIPDGGPDGGDGGCGGDIVFETDRGLDTLSAFRHKYKFAAQDGQEGKKKRMHGRDGAGLVLKVPEGTVIKEAKSGKIVADMSGGNKRAVVLKGGRGGLGNMHFATSVMQAPRYAKPGEPGEELEVVLELRLIADVGLVGFPNVGKSTLLARVSNAEPKIADYPFTTVSPVLGVVDVKDAKSFVMADIPGLIEGASKGAGLGHEFLRHIKRTKMMIHVIDVSGSEGRDPVDDVYKINAELKAYDESLASRPQVIAANKTDLIYNGGEEQVGRLKAEFEPEGVRVCPISAVSGKGVEALLHYVSGMLSRADAKPVVFGREYFPEKSPALRDPGFSVEIKDGVFVVDGPKIEKMLGYTNLDSEKGFAFFQKFLKDTKINDALESAGVKEGDTVRIYGREFEYYR